MQVANCQLWRYIGSTLGLNSVGISQRMQFASLLQGGSNMTGTDLYVNKPHGAAAVRP